MIKEWDLDTFTCLRALKGHEGSVNDIIVLENRIVSGGEDKCILWDLSPKKELPTNIKGNLQSNKKSVLKPKLNTNN